MENNKLAYYLKIDGNAKEVAIDFSNDSPITERVLNFIGSMYTCAKLEQKFKDDFFETAYHAPVTSDLEFFIARILYHYAKLIKRDWKILLRRQKGRTAPDIRLEKGNKTFAILEIKAKAGWIQPFLSLERYQHDKNRLQNGLSKFDPDDLIAQSRSQLKKYFEAFDITEKDVFLFLPTLALVHRKKYNTELEGYYQYFSTTSGLPKENLILLSQNKSLDLSKNVLEPSPTTDFEGLLTRLARY